MCRSGRYWKIISFLALPSKAYQERDGGCGCQASTMGVGQIGWKVCKKSAPSMCEKSVLRCFCKWTISCASIVVGSFHQEGLLEIPEVQPCFKWSWLPRWGLWAIEGFPMIDMIGRRSIVPRRICNGGNICFYSIKSIIIYSNLDNFWNSHAIFGYPIFCGGPLKNPPSWSMSNFLDAVTMGP